MEPRVFRRVAGMLRSLGSSWVATLGAAHWALEVPPVIEPVTEAEVRAMVDEGIRDIEAYLSARHPAD